MTLHRSPLRRMSVKRAASLPARRKCLDVVRKRAGGRCELRTPACTGVGVTGHEPLLRAQGGDETDPEQVRWTCAACHRYSHNHVAESYANGWLIRRNG